ncbi:MAG: T9SS type A sorting domain-containing protein [Bacteroidales bacterium]|nr:T9SS type A sorting domain-containing protein [Bacteroidales bacterium]
MKKSLLPMLALFIGAMLLNSPIRSQAINDTAVMGSGYANDVYYSMENGVVKTEPRVNWDIAFYTNRWSAGVMINEGMGMRVFTYPLADTSGWNTVDISGIDSWPSMSNSDTIWEDGAFNRNALGHPDYGWGVYNTINHDVIGDSLYIVQMADASYKKLWIQRKNSTANTYYFKYANIDGSNEVSEVLDVSPYESKLFVYYSLTIAAVADREPALTSWDILFSKYMAIVFDGEGNPSYYPVVGALLNPTSGANRFSPVGPDYEDWYAAPMESTKTPIGHNWKTFDMNTFSWLIEENLAYFVQTQEGNVYKLVFDYFSGSGSGKIGFVKKLVSMVSVNEQADAVSITAFPNPASNQASIHFDKAFTANAQLKVYDQSGRLVCQYQVGAGNNAFLLPLDKLTNGLYIIRVEAEGNVAQHKLVVQN